MPGTRTWATPRPCIATRSPPRDPRRTTAAASFRCSRWRFSSDPRAARRAGRAGSRARGLADGDLFDHAVDEVWLAVLGVGPEADHQVVASLERHGERGALAGVDPRDAAQPAIGGQRTLFAAGLPLHDIRRRFSPRELRHDALLRLQSGGLHPTRVGPGPRRPLRPEN